MNAPISIQIIKEAIEKDYSYEFIGEDNYLLRVDNGKNHCFIGAGDVGSYPVNSVTASKIATDKTHSYQVLKNNGYKIPIGESFFIKNKDGFEIPVGKGFKSALEYSREIGYPLFVKPNSGSRGVNCKCVHGEKELIEQIKLIQDDHMILVQKPVKGDEYRIFILNGEPVFAYKKDKKGCYVVANISKGTQILELYEEFSSEFKQFCKKISEDFDLDVIGLDVITEKSFENVQKMTILEVNANPALKGVHDMGRKNLVKKIMLQVLSKYFNSKKEKLLV